MNREDRIILLSSHAVLGPEERDNLREAAVPGLDWERILRVSRQERVCCLMYHHFRALDLERNIPGSVRGDLRSLYYEVSACNTLIISLAKDLLEAFNERRLPVILLKGVFLAGFIYPVIGCRPMTDIDLLAREEDISAIGGILGVFGYYVTGEKSLAKGPFAYSLTFEAADKTRLPLTIDMHFNLLTSSWLVGLCGRKLDIRRVWSKAVSIRFEGVKALGLSPEHLLIFLAGHSFSHDYQRLIMLTDIEGLIRKSGGDLDLREAAREAERFGLDNILADALKRVGKLSQNGGAGQASLFKRGRPGWSSIRYAATRPGLSGRIGALAALAAVFLRMKTRGMPFTGR